MTTAHDITTAQELLSAAPQLGRCELVRGELIMMSPSGFEHGVIVARIASPLHAFVKKLGLGLVTGAETGFLIARKPDTVRAPDVGFVRAKRAAGALTKGFFLGAPDLAVEVLSPGDRPGEVTDKVNDWLGAGCQTVWVVDPEKRTVQAYRSDSEPVVWSEEDELDGGQMAPGFCLPVAEIFP